MYSYKMPDFSESPELRKDGKPKLKPLGKQAYESALRSIEFTPEERELVETVASSRNQGVAAVKLEMSYKDLTKVFNKIRRRYNF